MSDSDTPLEGPLSIDDALDAMADREEAAPEVEESENAEVEIEVDEAEENTDVDETDEQEEPDDEGEGPDVYDVGEYGEIAIQLSDGTQTTLAELEKGTLRQADYTRKTTELSSARKQLQDKASELAQRERQINEQLASLNEPEPDWAKMAEEDPLGLPLAQIQWNKKQQEKAQKRAEVDAATEREKMDFQRQTVQKALEVMPQWADGKSFQETSDARKQAALDAGFTETEYNGALDFRLAVILEKAALYDAGQTKVKAATKKLSKVTKVVKPGASVTKADKEQAAKTAKSKRLNKPMGVNEYLDAILDD